MLLSPAAAAAARDWIVSPAGKPGASGTVAQPAEVHDALSRATEGDSLILSGGTYNVDTTLTLGAARLTLCAAEGAKPVISAGTANRRVGSVVVVAAPGCLIRGLDISGGYTYAVKVDAPECSILDCRIHGSGRDCIKLAVTADRSTIARCEIYDSGLRDPSNAEGIDNVACDDVVVKDCNIHNIATNGLYMKGGARRCVVESNLVSDCGDNGIMLGQSTDRQWNENWPYECFDSVARGNVVERIHGAGLSFEAAKDCRFESNFIRDAGTRSHGGISVQANEHKTPCINVTFTGNTIVMYAARPMVAVHAGGVTAVTDVVCDRNIFYSKQGLSFAYEPGDILLRSLADWQKATGYDMNSKVAESEPVAPALKWQGSRRPANQESGAAK